jgi:DNA repair exonuclease SbcCD ATPase subunit
MAAPAAIPDHKLEDRISHLHKRSRHPGLVQILEEATQLWGVGRHLEAVALVEKAEAMTAVVSHQDTGSKAAAFGPNSESTPATSSVEQPFAARLAADVATGLNNVLIRAIQDLEQHITGESSRLSSTFGERLDRLQSSVESLQPLHARLDQLVQAGIAAQEKYEQLAATAKSLREDHTRIDAEVGALKLQLHELSASSSSRFEEVCRRIEGQDREIATVQSSIAAFTPKVAAAAEKLERHANAIRSIHRAHHERAEVLGQVGELLDRFKATPVLPNEITL